MILLLHRWEMVQGLVANAAPEGVSVARSIPNALDLLEMAGRRYELAIVEPFQYPSWEEMVGKVDLVLLTGEVGTGLVGKALKVGAKGVLSTGISLQGLKVALDLVRKGECVFPATFSQSEEEGVNLSPRQRQVLVLTAKGRNAVEIGEELGVVPGYVNNVRARVYEKLGIQERGQGRIQAAVAWAVEHNLT